MNKHHLKNTLAVLCIFCYNFAINAQNSTCITAQIIEPGTFEVDSLTGQGAIFQGATAAAWYLYQPTEYGVFTVSSCEGGGDTRLVVFLLDDCNKPNEVQIINSVEDNCADGIGGQTASSLEIVAVSGIPYYIYWDNGQSNDSFSWQLNFQSDSPNIEGDKCTNALNIEEGTHQVESLTGTGTAFTDAVSAKWYAFTPKRNGALFINSCESAINTRLFVWENNCPLKQILAQDDDGCGENGASDLANVIVRKGETYYIYWDDHYTNQGFNFDLAVGDPTSSYEEPEWANSIILFPNPVVEQIFVDYQFKTPTNLTVTIINQLGQAILQENWRTFLDGTVEIPVTTLTNGVYFMRMEAGGEVLQRPFSVFR